MFDSVVAANRAAFAAFGVTGDHDGTTDTLAAHGANATATTDASEVVDGPSIEARETRETWEVTVTVNDREHLGVGDRVEFEKTLTDADVRRFAVSSGDTNPLHLDDDFASKTRFRGRIAHGTLVGGLISAALARLPGLTIYLSQDLEFHNPVRIDDRLIATCEIVEDLGDDQYRLTTRVFDEDQDEVIIDGEAVVLIDELPDDD
jgi:acyl dehydratase